MTTESDQQYHIAAVFSAVKLHEAFYHWHVLTWRLNYLKSIQNGINYHLQVTTDRCANAQRSFNETMRRVSQDLHLPSTLDTRVLYDDLKAVITTTRDTNGGWTDCLTKLTESIYNALRNRSRAFECTKETNDAETTVTNNPLNELASQ
jgi:hypothetical protein